MKIYKNIDTVSSITEAEFSEKYLKPQKPVVIKGFSNLYPAGRKWNIDFLKDYCGDVSVELFDNNIKNHTSSAFTTPDLQMRFRDYADILTREEPSNLRMFLFNMFKKKPGLRKFFPYPYLFKGFLCKIGYMFFGCKNIKVRIHQDIDMSNVLLTQFEGRKRVVLVSPEYSELLYRLPFNTYSLVDLDNPDYDKYPGLKYVECSEVILEKGDALFMPSGFWHYITYLDWGYAVSYRKLSDNFKTLFEGFLNIAVYLPFDKFMNFIMGKKWLEGKQLMAEKRANDAIIRKFGNTGYVSYPAKAAKQHSGQPVLKHT